MYEVKAVALLPERTDRLLGFEIDDPRAGARRHLHVLHMTGWTVGRDARADAVEVLTHGRLLRTVPVRGPRADVAAALNVPPDTECVFHAMVGLVGLKREASLHLRVVLSDGTRVDAGAVSVVRQPLSSGYEPSLMPLMVTTLGRSGSTWLMQILASHPEIVTFRRFPYESTPAKYWMHMLRVLSEPANLVESAQPDNFHNDLWWVGSNPYHDDRVYEQMPLEHWFGKAYPEHLAAFAQRQIDDWYLTLARTQVQPAPVYFAEKHMWPNFVPVLTWELYPRAKEVFLVRDFRDMTRSILSFDERRGYAGFGRPAGASDDQYMRGVLRQMAHDLKQSWQTRKERAHLVRYEDLVLDPEQTVAAMLEYLGVDVSPATLQHVLKHASEEVLTLPGSGFEQSEIRVHRTVSEPRASIGRWRNETDAAFHELSEEVFGEALREFGYPT
jgi:hypothetical protein